MDRKKTLGGSDIPAVANLDPYRTPLDVYLEKKGEAPPREETWPMRLGTEQEALVANWYGRERNVSIENHPQVIHPKFAWVSGSPDRVMTQMGKVIRGLECKFRSERMRDKYGDPGTDEVLPSDMAQCCWYMLLFPMAEAWDVAVQFGNQERLIYTVPRDAELIEMFLETGREFWESHILTDTPPPLDGSKSASDYLKRKYPSDNGPLLEPTDEEILDIIEDFQVTKRVLKQTEDYAAQLENQLKEFIGDFAGVKGDFGKITWKKNKDGQTLDYKAMAAAYPEIAAQFMKPKPGVRVFRPYFKGE